MTAPALVLLGHGGDDPRVDQVSHALRSAVLEIRPELDIHVAFLDRGHPTGLQLVNQLVRHRVGEVVFVPLSLSDAFASCADVPAMVSQVQAAHPAVRVIASRPVGPDAQLLSVVDRRLRDALRARRVCELDGLVFAAAGSADLRSNAIVARRARQWAGHHRLPCLTAFAGAAGPSTAEAIRTLRSHGRRHIAVGSWFLAPDVSYTHQADQAYDAGSVAVSEPLGGAEVEVAEAVLARYVVAAMELVDLEPSAVGSAGPAPVRHLSVVGA